MEAILSLLIPVLMQIESGGDPSAIGDGGAAVGILQIHPCVIADVNRVYATSYTLADRLDPVKSHVIARSYLVYWGFQYQRQTGLTITIANLARIWNGGPNGWKKESTLNYWHKVQKELNHGSK